MDLKHYEEVAKTCEEKATYFNKIDFTILASAYSEAALAIRELLKFIEQVKCGTEQRPQGEENGE